jgi:hypothetical protein
VGLVVVQELERLAEHLEQELVQPALMEPLQEVVEYPETSEQDYLPET